MEYKYKKELNNVLGALFNFYLIYLVFGMVFGFRTNSYSLKLSTLIKNVAVTFITMTFIELLRYVIIKKNKKIWVINILTIILIIIEFILNLNSMVFNNLLNTMITIARYIMPIVGRNILMSYITYKYDYKISLVYSLIVNTYIYYMKNVPNIIECIYGILLFLLSYYTFIMIDSNNTGNRYIKLRIIIFIMYIIFYSGIFNIELLPVYNSDSDTILRSDAVLVYNGLVKDGDNIVYRNSNIYVVSNVVKIDYYDDTKYYYVKIKHDGEYALVPDNNLKGIVKMNIPYMGYVPVLINDIEEAILEYLTIKIYG